jgi:hypothetical protein
MEPGNRTRNAIEEHWRASEAGSTRRADAGQDHLPGLTRRQPDLTRRQWVAWTRVPVPDGRRPGREPRRLG